MFGGRRLLPIVTCLCVLALSAGSCGDDTESVERASVPTGESTTTSEATTTTEPAAPAFEALPADPALTPEQQVEAAYLHSWDIYLDAVGRGDTQYLHLVYASGALDIVTDEVEGLVADGHTASGAPEFDYNIGLVPDVDGMAIVLDAYRNHLVLRDAETGEPLEDDPNSVALYQFTLELKDDVWYVFDIA